MKCCIGLNYAYCVDFTESCIGKWKSGKIGKLNKDVKN
jgi:hypothetical protein